MGQRINLLWKINCIKSLSGLKPVCKFPLHLKYNQKTWQWSLESFMNCPSLQTNHVYCHSALLTKFKAHEPTFISSYLPRSFPPVYKSYFLDLPIYFFNKFFTSSCFRSPLKRLFLNLVPEKFIMTSLH